MPKLYLARLNTPDVDCSERPDEAICWGTREEAEGICRYLNPAGISSEPEQKELRKRYKDFRVEEFDSEFIVVCDCVPSNQF